MPTNKQFADHTFCLDQLKIAQDADTDMREQAREAALFVTKRDGQWEPKWWESNKNRPRYTFDQTNPIVDQIAGALERSDFDIHVTPGGSAASKEVAETLDGLIRNIENISSANQVYNAATRRMVIGGLSGWRVAQKYADEDSFDQDLVVQKIGNFIDRVWFGPFEEQDASDATMAWVLTGMSKEDHKVKYPDSNQESVGTDENGNAYYHRHDLVMVGEFLYIKESPRDLVLMSSGKIYPDDKDFKKLEDELKALGVTEVSRRTGVDRTVYTRKFDPSGWLEKEQATVFDWLPVIPCFANFDVLEDKVTYHGAVEKIMDAQRVMNYSLSREIEEGALAPRAKYFMTEAQVEGHLDTLQTMNVNSDPIQLFNVDPELPGPPVQSGGAQINPGLRTVSEAMKALIGQSAGMHAASMGENPGLQSGIAINQLQDKANEANNKFATSREVAQQHTAKILIKAIPKVYTPGRQVRLLGEDGALEFVTIGEQMQDQQTGEMITLNNVSEGSYSVTCQSGPSFKNRQSETVNALTELGSIDPSVIQLGGDILAKNVSAPGMRDIAERKRALLFKDGVIPEAQLTDEEKQQLQQQAQQPPQPDPMMVAAQAEQQKAQADMQEAQNKQVEIQGNQQAKKMELELKAKQIEVDFYKAETDRFGVKIDQGKAMAEIKGKGAQAAKALSEAEAQDIENDSVTSGITSLLEQLNGG